MRIKTKTFERINNIRFKKERVEYEMKQLGIILDDLVNENEELRKDLLKLNEDTVSEANLIDFRSWQKKNWKDVYLMCDELMIETYINQLGTSDN